MIRLNEGLATLWAGRKAVIQCFASTWCRSPGYLWHHSSVLIALLAALYHRYPKQIKRSLLS